MNVDVAIIGAGPAGLCFSRFLEGSGLSVVLVEQQAAESLREPAFDGREIALTHASRHILERLDIWQQFDPAEISPLRDAQVLDGESLFAMKIEAERSGHEELGYLVPNQAIRRAAFASISAGGNAQLRAGVRLVSLHQQSDGVALKLSDGSTIQARLLVAADSRFSETRRMLGIGADMRDFGRSMMVCRMDHEVPHHHVAWEWFDYGQTLALLPLNGNRSGVVLTLPQHAMHQIMALDEADFAAEMTKRFSGRLGAMKQAGSRHLYPLVGVYAQRLIAQRAALIGDAAVGMHPVTAHGFNFGLQSGEKLASRVLEAYRAGRDIADPALLESYERAHRLATWPIYQGTNFVASLYTDDRMPAKWLRKAVLRVADHVAPLKKAIAAHLTQA